MVMIWLFVLGSVIVVSLISFIGLLGFQAENDRMRPFLLVLVSFSAGALLGDVFIHLLPEAVEEKGLTLPLSLWILGSILVFFVLEKFIHWHHCHLPEAHQHMKPLAFMNLVGDGLHNFIDGAMIAGSYLISLPLGFATTIAVALHEIPQEIGDFGVLIHAGLQKSKVVFLNFISALTAILGAVIVLGLGVSSASVTGILTPFTVGGFLYIAGTDLIPELHKETNPVSSLIQLISFIGGIAVMLALLLIE
ncbi:ZIP family metal transporter [Candidatus Peregrinibacteria bacterium]|nr:ZIP family metal transporter [Candidatus Peregrinibacteria bacterium]